VAVHERLAMKAHSAPSSLLALCLFVLAGLLTLSVATLPARAADAGDITGTVTSTTHVGLAGVEVRAYSADGSGTWGSVSFTDTAPDGSYDLAGLAAGSYRLEFSDPSGSYVTQYYDNQPDLASASDVTVTAAATTAHIDATLIALDTTPPTTAATGADSLWHNSPVSVTFTATDNPGGSGMSGGQAKTEYQLDGGSWVSGTQCTVAAPADHSDDGQHSLSYRSTDAVGNVEPAKSVAVSIDTEGPLTSAQATGGRRGQVVPLSYRVDDKLSAMATAVVIVVRNDHGKVVRSFGVGTTTVGSWHEVEWTPTATGSYSYAVTAKDLAGNTQVDTGSARVTVRSEWVTIGYSVRRRPIVAARFGSGSRHILVIGGVHGNEFGTAVATQFAAYLASHPAAVPAGAAIDVIRCLNPDGYARHARGNARHVDLNRNLPTANWRRILKRGDPSRSLGLTGGAGPGSEPETKALLAYLRQGFAAVLSLHSRAGILDYNGPGGASLARRMSALCGLPPGHVGYEAYITGSLGDYVPATYAIPTITVELRSATLSSGLRAALLVGAR
jgi:hypothetical protein